MWKERLLANLRITVLEEATLLTGRTAVEVTDRLTEMVVAVVRDSGFEAVAECRISSNTYIGQVDVVGRWPRGKLAVAVEIDRGNKSRSLAKLAAASKSGALAVWIRWGKNMPSEIGLPIPADIALIEAPLDYLRASPGDSYVT